ncbi:MAG: hypothetical protein H0X08_05870 [Blastocatellia bacterium]|nr:hypothetical protein [Blastocatellia bacterium]
MDKYFLIAVLGFASFSCHVRESQSLENSSEPPIPQSSNFEKDTEPKAGETNTIVESFSNNSSIGRPKRNKIQIDITERGGVDSAYRPNNVSIIKFYSIGPTKQWVLKQTLEIDDHALADSDPQIEDFNNDGWKDVTFRSNTAARGSNEIRTLLTYDKINDVLIHVKNSEDYPNLAYNKTLSCIDTWSVHGTSTTVFLRLEGDMLKEFTSVGTGANRAGTCCDLAVKVVDKAGKETVIRRKKITEDDIYTRYRTFNPPQP